MIAGFIAGFIAWPIVIATIAVIVISCIGRKVRSRLPEVSLSPDDASIKLKIARKHLGQITNRASISDAHKIAKYALRKTE